jgi:hypothetical protein
VSEREDFDAWFQRRYSCSNFNGSWEATAAMGHAWNGWQERARRTVSGQETEPIYQVISRGICQDVTKEQYDACEGKRYERRIVYAAPIAAKEKKS